MECGINMLLNHIDDISVQVQLGAGMLCVINMQMLLFVVNNSSCLMPWHGETFAARC